MKHISKIKYLVICLVFMYSCKSDNSKYPYSETNGLITKTYLNDSTILVKEYYDNNSLKSITTFNNKGEKHGEYIKYYENKNIKEKGWFKSNQENGKWFYYSSDNNLTETHEYVCGDNRISHDINFNKDLSIDTTKVNHYSTIDAIQDTIYDGEPYVFNVRLITPYFPKGMYVVLIDSEDEYCNIEKNRGFKYRFNCEGFEQRIAINDYSIGKNTIRGIILNYGEDTTKLMKYYFHKDYYVKERYK